MMYPSKSLTKFAVMLAPLVVGTPVPEPVADPAQIEEHKVGGVYLTTDINWSGTKGYKVQPLNECIVLTAPWYNSISSFGPDPGTCCRAYTNPSCTECPSSCTWGLNINNPGYADLTKTPLGNWNDVFESFKCWAC